MICQGTTIHVLESKALHVANRYRLLIGQVLLVMNANKILGKVYLYIQYLSSVSMYN